MVDTVMTILVLVIWMGILIPAIAVGGLLVWWWIRKLLNPNFDPRDK